MQFRRITVRNFRKLTSTVDLDGIGDGVTVIAGDNEEGKSTLLDAIRTGLFQRHNVTGKPVESMQPFGSKVRPEICLEFQIDGGDYRIEKGFAQKPSARLTTPNGVFEGPEAEDRLAGLLNFRVAERGASKADDWGVLGLFWLKQGTATDGLGVGETGRSTLRGALEDEVGDVLGGAQGRSLLEAARLRRSELLTNTGRPRPAVVESIAAVTKAEESVQALEQARSEYDREIDELDRVRRELARIETDRVMDTARKALTAALEEASAIESLRAEVASAGQALSLAEANANNLSDRWQQRQTLIQALSDTDRNVTAAAALRTRSEADTHAITHRLTHAGEQMTAATEQRSRHEQRLAMAQMAARIARLEKDNGALRETLSQVEQLATERAAARKVRNAIAIDQTTFDALQDLDMQVREARAAVNAAATRLCFAPKHDQTVVRDGEPVLPGEFVDVTRPTNFSVEGYGTVKVEPGATDLEERHEQRVGAEHALTEALRNAGAPTLAEARTLLSQRTAAEATLQETTRLMEAHARDGEEALRKRLADGESALERLKADHVGLDESAVNLDEEQQQSIAARSIEGAARDALEAARLEHQAHQDRLASAIQQIETMTRARDDAAAQLQAARDTTADADLALTLETNRAALQQARAAREQCERRLAAANPQEIELRRKQAEAALEQVQQEEARLREQSIGLEVHLRTLGRDGIAEQLEDARGNLERAARRRDNLVDESAAWDLLVTTLERAERDAKEAFLGPVLERVDPFLQLILPGTRISLNEETLEIEGVTRDGRHEPYEDLSGGTREQIAILVRLAFAVYLREKNFPATVILDDALVYADDDRFERMQLALHKAAESVQILILTCRPRDWRQFGAPIRRLATARS